MQDGRIDRNVDLLLDQVRVFYARLKGLPGKSRRHTANGAQKQGQQHEPGAIRPARVAWQHGIIDNPHVADGSRFNDAQLLGRIQERAVKRRVDLDVAKQAQ